jgi:predicted phosphate transport protein (TIGR00153 family)
MLGEYYAIKVDKPLRPHKGKYSMSILSMFAPKSGKFFDSFERATSNLVNMSGKLKELVSSRDQQTIEGIVREIRDLEHVGDDITHHIFTELSENFITPFDREDIHVLAKSIDDVADHINGTASRIVLYKYEQFDQVLHSLTAVLHRQTQEIEQAIQSLKGMRNVSRIKEAIVRLNDLENEADSIFDLSIARLFSEESNAIEMIKKKEILSVLESATDKCEDVANVLETILVKNS